MSWDKFDEEASREGEAFNRRYRSVWNPRRKVVIDRSAPEDHLKKNNVINENRLENTTSVGTGGQFGLGCLDEDWGQEGEE